MTLDDLLRDRILRDKSILHVARQTGVAQSTLQEFAVGKSDGSYADIRISSAIKLMEYYGVGSVLSEQAHGKRRSSKMKLAVELEAHGCQDSPEKFEMRLIETLTGFYEGTTIDDLVCTPDLAAEYCVLIREGIGVDVLFDPVILKGLMNIRKRKDCPKGLKSNRTRTVLKRALANAECDLEPAEFKELLVDCLADMYKNQTIDELVCHPREAKGLCNYVRRKAFCNGLSDTLILRSLMNIRKSADS